MTSTLSRYIAWRVLKGIGLAFLIVTAIIALVDYVEASRNLGADTDLSSLSLLTLTAYRVPKLIEETIPFVVLFGVMGALASMNRRSELTVIRASGQSAWRFLRPALFVTGLLGVAWSLLLNPLASSLMSTYETRITSYSGIIEAEDIWLREGSTTSQRVIQAGSLDIKPSTTQ